MPPGLLTATVDALPNVAKHAFRGFASKLPRPTRILSTVPWCPLESSLRGFDFELYLLNRNKEGRKL